MATYIITRHGGAVEWLRRHHPELGDAKLVAHASDEFFNNLQPGDVVVGVLPVSLAARVCARRAKFYHIDIRVPAGLRGQELSADDMERLNARLQHYIVLDERAAQDVLSGGDYSPA